MKKAIITLALIAAVAVPGGVASAGHKTTPPAPTPPPAPAHVCFYNGQQLPGLFYGTCPNRYIFGV